MKKIRNKNMTDIQNIMTLTLNTTSRAANNAVLDGWTFEIEDEGVRTGTSLKSLKSFLTAMTYVLHEVDPKDVWADSIFQSSKTIMCHIYSHELNIVFHWLRNIFPNNMSVFTNTWMKPITADININNVIFRLHDTSRLVPKTIEEWAKDENLTGNIVMNGMKKYRETYGSLYNIPVSQAGEVRREMKKKVTDKAWVNQTKDTIKSYSFNIYKDLVSCFMGGTIGVNPMYKNLLIHNVKSNDLASAYTGVMATRRFPVSPWEECKYDENDKEHVFYMTVKFIKPRSKYINKFYPFKKCDDGINQIDEGIALESAEEVTLTLTDIDFNIFKKTYDYDSYEIIKCMRSKADYLPKQLIKLLLKYYCEKTELKGTNQVSKYRKAKIYNNCFYGVAVTKSITDDIVFADNKWKKIEIKTEDDFNKKRNELLKTKQVLSYQIGVWVTAYVREIIWNIIPEIDKNVIYFDTDCIKYKGETNAFARENERLLSLIKSAAEHHGLPVSMYCPKNKPIGLFEPEDESIDFKALNVKQYAKKTKDGVEGFISGMPKEHIAIKNVNDLNYNMKWEPGKSGRFNIIYNEGKEFTVSKMPAGFSIRAYNNMDIFAILTGRDINTNSTKIFSNL